MKAKVGDRVQHYGTKQWGTVPTVKPQHDGTDEYEVQPDKPYLPNLENKPTWWASYHLRAVESASEEARADA